LGKRSRFFAQVKHAEESLSRLLAAVPVGQDVGAMPLLLGAWGAECEPLSLFYLHASLVNEKHKNL
jgi:hypothetical protein